MRKLLLGVLFILAGILGLGVGAASAEPLSNNKQVVTGQNHSCALTRTGQVTCWGDNTTGALGDGTFDSSVTPVAVKGVGGVGELTKVKQITAGDGHTCALLTNRRVVCWGDNELGQFGDGTFTNSNIPVAV
ncbi:MAG: RCC1 domain-containing protein, partial [Acidimicrobiales bacterium]